MLRRRATSPALLVATLVGGLVLTGCSDEPAGSVETSSAPDLGLGECFSVQQIALEASPDGPAVAPARLDASTGVGFTRDAMCVDFTLGLRADGWDVERTRVRVVRANRQDAWAGAVFERVLPGSASDEGADRALPLVVPFDYAGRYGGRGQCFLITIEATVSRGSVEGTWSTSGKRGICPGTRFDRESLSELEE